MTEDKDKILESNVSTLLEAGGEPPKLNDVARARIRAKLIADFGTQDAVIAPPKSRKKLYVGFGVALAAAAAIAIVVKRPAHVGGDVTAPLVEQKLADGTTYIAEPGAKVAVLGPRKIRLEGAVLLDVVPGKGVFTVETDHGTISVLGTRFVADATAEQTSAAVVRGEVKLANDVGDVILHAGEQAIALRGKAPVRQPAPRLSHLVSWAQQARRAEEHDTTAHHGTLFARDPGVRSHPPWGNEYPLPITKLGVDVVVEDQVARIALDQTFHNNANEDLEGMYRFAIPPDAALQRLAMYVDGKLEESAVVERMRARRIYEELVYRRVDPALLEWAGVGRLALRVYPLKANQDKRLMLAYTQSTPKLYDDYTITVPLPDVDQTVGEMDVSVKLKGCGNCEVESTSHPITTERAGDDALVKVHRTNEKLGDSFVLHVRDTRHRTITATADDAGEKFMMVRAPVKLDAAQHEYKPRTWIVLDDVSASRNSADLHAQRDFLGAMLNELDENDRVGVVAFDVQARTKLAPTRVLDVDRKALRKALDGEGGVGATDIEAALGQANQLLAGVDPDNAFIVYLGDGMITSGDRHLDALRTALQGKAHFVGVGIGDGPDTQTLGMLAGATGGYSTTVDLADDLGWRAFDLVAALHTERVTGLETKLVDANGALVPATNYLASPQLADGEELELVTKLAGDKAPVALELTGTLDGKPWSQRIALDHATGNAGYLPRLWAQRHINARLLAKQEPVTMVPCISKCISEAETREARDEKIRQEVVALGKKYFLLSRHTSLLVLENDAMYAQYDVKKGAGDTWAPYAMPATIPVVTTNTPVPVHVNVDAEVGRAPLQVFYDYGYQYRVRDMVFASQMEEKSKDKSVDDPFALDSFKKGKANDDWSELQQPMETRAIHADADARFRVAGGDDIYGGLIGGEGEFGGGWAGPVGGKTIGFGAGTGSGYGVGRFGTLALESRRGFGGLGYYGYDLPMVVKLAYPADPNFDDLTAFVPALSMDAADVLRRGLGEPTDHTISAEARTLLDQARQALPAGVYTYGGRTVAIDSSHRFAWKTTTDWGLDEVAAFDGAMFTRTYGELDLAVQRPVTSDDVALGLAYLPMWIVDPAHYAKYFDVTANGREVVLSQHGKPVYTLTFDATNRLAKINGQAITWQVTPQAIADARQWIATPGVSTTIDLPGRGVQFWQDQLKQQVVGSAPWQHAARQLMVAAAAENQKPLAWQTYRLLKQPTHGDLVLASGGAAQATDAEMHALGNDEIGMYLEQARLYTRQQMRGITPPAFASNGLLKQLSSMRLAEQQFQAKDYKAAMTSFGQLTAQLPKQVIATSIGQNYDTPVEIVTKLWDATAVDGLSNIARAHAALILAQRGKLDDAIARLNQLVDSLDLAAAPPAWNMITGYVAQRGEVAMDVLWAKLRAKVFASDSFEHVLAVLPVAQQRGDTVAVLNRAADLANADQSAVLAQTAITYGQVAWLQPRLVKMLAAAPTPEMYHLAANAYLQVGDLQSAFDMLETAQAKADDKTSAQMMRSEYAALINLAQRLAETQSGQKRETTIEHGMKWGTAWRAVDPGNPQIDAALGEMLLAVGDEAGAWRQLSTVIEREPWTGTGYMTVAETFQRRGKVEQALPYWQQAIVIDQTNPTPRLRKAQALLALGRKDEARVLVKDITSQKWHDVWSNVLYEAQELNRQLH
ncbi:MAG: VIT domain-containing protein [Kofleriaceae bacterium]